MKKAITRTIVRLAVLALVIAIGYSFFGKVETVKHDPVLADSNGNVTTTMHNIDNMEVVTLDVPESTEAPVVEETMPEVPAPILWDENVDLVPYYHEQDANMMSYLLYTPTNIQEGQKLPLLIWLHGSGEKNVDEATFRTRGLPAVLPDLDRKNRTESGGDHRLYLPGQYPDRPGGFRQRGSAFEGGFAGNSGSGGFGGVYALWPQCPEEA